MSSFDLALGVLVVSMIMIIINPYSGFVFALTAMGNVTNETELHKFAFAGLAMSLFVTLVIKGRNWSKGN